MKVGILEEQASGSGERGVLEEEGLGEDGLEKAGLGSWRGEKLNREVLAHALQPSSTLDPYQRVPLRAAFLRFFPRP